MKARTIANRSTAKMERRRGETVSRASRSPRSSIPPTRILVPIDLSECSRTALQCAVRMARPLKASLLLLYVAETNPAGSELGPCRVSDLESELRRIAKRQLARFKDQEIPPDIATRSIIRAGRPDCVILEAAKNSSVDVIIMTTHGKDSLPGQLGATAGRVASMARCPVVLVPTRESTVPFFL